VSSEPDPGSPIRVVLAEDNVLVREGLLRILEAEPDIHVVAACPDLDSLYRMVDHLDPDVVVTDIRMPPTGTDEGIAAAVELRRRAPGLGVVILSQYDDPNYALALLESGSEARGYLLKDRLSAPRQVAAAIREVAAGGSVIDPKIVEALVKGTRRGPSAVDELTPREREVLGEMAQGKSNEAIATVLGTSIRAVEKHINAVFSKLQLSEEPLVHRRVKAVLVFLAQA
jgi:DNA-binding NarL/FixJ family response regulator